MASRRFGSSAALSMLEIPLPEDDDMSDDKFDSYVDPDEAPNDGEVGGDDHESESDNDVPSIDMSDKTPLDFFKLLVANEMLDLIVEQTNIYAQQFIDTANLPPHSQQAEEVSGHDNPMGLVNYPQVKDYWVTYWPYSTPTFSKVLLYLLVSL